MLNMFNKGLNKTNINRSLNRSLNKGLLLGLFSMFIIGGANATEAVELTEANYDIVSGHTITINNAAQDFVLDAKYTNFPSTDDETAWRTDWSTANSVLTVSNLSAQNCTLDNLRSAENYCGTASTDGAGVVGNFTPSLTDNATTYLITEDLTGSPLKVVANTGNTTVTTYGTNTANYAVGKYSKFKVLSSNIASDNATNLGYLGKDGTVYTGLFYVASNKDNAELAYAKYDTGVWKHGTSKTVISTNFADTEVFDHISIQSAPDYVGKISVMASDPTTAYTVKVNNDYVYAINPVSNTQAIDLDNTTTGNKDGTLIIENKNYDMSKLTGAGNVAAVLQAK